MGEEQVQRAALEMRLAELQEPQEESTASATAHVSDSTGELESRILELRRLEARHEAAMEKSEERQRRDQAELQRERDALRLQREEQQLIAEEAEAACSSRARALTDQQGLLERERLEVESSRVAGEAERLMRLDALRAEQHAVERHQEELWWQRSEEEA